MTLNNVNLQDPQPDAQALMDFQNISRRCATTYWMIAANLVACNDAFWPPYYRDYGFAALVTIFTCGYFAYFYFRYLVWFPAGLFWGFICVECFQQLHLSFPFSFYPLASLLNIGAVIYLDNRHSEEALNALRKRDKIRRDAGNFSERHEVKSSLDLQDLNRSTD